MENFLDLSIEELLRRCSSTDSGDAWLEFVRRFHRLIAAVALRTADRFGDGSKQTVDELVQETYLKLCAENFRILRTFRQQHPDAFLGYIKVVTANVVRDHFKSAYSKKRGAARIEQVVDDSKIASNDHAVGTATAIERVVLLEEVKQYLELCVPGPEHERSRRIFWLYYRVGLSARAIAEVESGLTAKGVESIVQRITIQLRDRMAASGTVHPRRQGVSKSILPA